MTLFILQRQTNGAIIRGIHETACIRSHPEIFGSRKVAIRKKFYIYGGMDQKYVRRPRRINQNIPLLMDHSGFEAQNNVATVYLNTQQRLFYTVYFLIVSISII